MPAKEIILNRDRACPKCGRTDVKVIGSPGTIMHDGQPLKVPVKYRMVVECTRCRSIRGQ